MGGRTGAHGARVCTHLVEALRIVHFVVLVGGVQRDQLLVPTPAHSMHSTRRSSSCTCLCKGLRAGRRTRPPPPPSLRLALPPPLLTYARLAQTARCNSSCIPAATEPHGSPGCSAWRGVGRDRGAVTACKQARPAGTHSRCAPLPHSPCLQLVLEVLDRLSKLLVLYQRVDGLGVLAIRYALLGLPEERHVPRAWVRPGCRPLARRRPGSMGRAQEDRGRDQPSQA